MITPLQVKKAVIRGYVVEKNAPPPPPRHFADGSSALAAELEIGDVIRGIPPRVCNAIRRWLLNVRGWGSEFRWVDEKKEKVDLWVLEKPTARQVMSQARNTGRPRPDKRRAAAE